MVPFLIVLCIMNIDTTRMPGINPLLRTIDACPAGDPTARAPWAPFDFGAPVTGKPR